MPTLSAPFGVDARGRPRAFDVEGWTTPLRQRLAPFELPQLERDFVSFCDVPTEVLAELCADFTPVKQRSFSGSYAALWWFTNNCPLPVLWSGRVCLPHRFDEGLRVDALEVVLDERAACRGEVRTLARRAGLCASVSGTRMRIEPGARR